MKIREVSSISDLKQFYYLSPVVYKNYPLHRSTEDEIMKMLVEKKSHFLTHSCIKSFIAEQNNDVQARFTLIRDKKLPEYVQVSFFEAMEGLTGIADLIISEARKHFPDQSKIVFGLNGHLNYGAGYLCNNFDHAPLFGLPYNPPYYHRYFSSLTKRSMVSFRFSNDKWSLWKNQFPENPDTGGITVRCMDKKQFQRDVRIYTDLNNKGFLKHPFWSDRSEPEDYELFHPFRFLIKEENLLFAEHNGNPIGFLLWYPDFNELVKSDRQLNILDVFRYKFANPIRSIRFTEIAVLPEYRVSKAVLAMILKLISIVEKSCYTHGEGGFIFKENNNSMSMASRYLERAFGEKFLPFREYAVYEGRM